MKARLLVSLILLLISILSVSFAEAGRSSPRPNLMLSEKTFRFTPHNAGETVSHDFVLTNTGPSVIKVHRVKTSCHCTVASFDREIPPGGSGQVRIAVDIKPEWAGKRVTQTAVIMTSDPGAKRTVVSLIVDVRP